MEILKRTTFTTTSWVTRPACLTLDQESKGARTECGQGEAHTESAQARRRAITGAHLVSLVRAGARFENGVLVERPEADAA